MKRVMSNYKSMTIALIVALTLNFSTAFANDEVKNIPGVEFRFLGHKENQPVFVLNLVNAEDDEYTISFRDKNGHVLYTDRIKGSNITKKFLLNTEELGTTELSVEIRAKKNNQVQVYKIGTTQSIVTETVVNKVK